MRKKHVIIGASAAGIGAVNRLARIAPDDQVICIAAQSVEPYNTCLLADYCCGKKTEQELCIFNRERASNHTTLKLGVCIDVIDPHEKRVSVSDGTAYEYDTLFIATGTSAIRPNVEGIDDGVGVFTFHTMIDCQQIMQYQRARQVKRAIVVGAGLTGLECADVLMNCGISVAIIEKHQRVLNQLVSKSGSDFIERAMSSRGVEFYPEEMVTRICMKNKHVVGVECASGMFLPADMVIFAVGVCKNDYLARQAGIAVSEYGIVTDKYLRTSVENIWAGGDVAQVSCAFTHQAITSCTWPDAMFQGLIAAHAMSGDLKIYTGATRIVDSCFFGMQFQAGGQPCGMVSYESVINVESSDDRISALYVENGKMVGYFGCSVHEISRTLKQSLLGVFPYTINFK